MKRGKRTFAEQGVRLLEAALQKAPPAGVSTKYVSAFFKEHRAQLATELAAQLDRVAAQKTESLEVLIHVIPNPDFAPGKAEASVEIPRRWVRVRSYADAIKRVREFITEYNLGAGNWIGGHIRQGGRVVARVSYNGRLWQTNETGLPTGYELSPDGKVLDYHSAADETKPACGCSHPETPPPLPPSPPAKRLVSRRSKKS